MIHVRLNLCGLFDPDGPTVEILDRVIEVVRALIDGFSPRSMGAVGGVSAGLTLRCICPDVGGSRRRAGGGHKHKRDRYDVSDHEDCTPIETLSSVEFEISSSYDERGGFTRFDGKFSRRGYASCLGGSHVEFSAIATPAIRSLTLFVGVTSIWLIPIRGWIRIATVAVYLPVSFAVTATFALRFACGAYAMCL